jgi:hypothetical protein
MMVPLKPLGNFEYHHLFNSQNKVGNIVKSSNQHFAKNKWTLCQKWHSITNYFLLD